MQILMANDKPLDRLDIEVAVVQQAVEAADAKC